jgi:hypothetical protein
MGKLAMATATEARRDRDYDLRAAHQAAFSKILKAREHAGYRDEVRRAVEELIDACETYIAQNQK